MFVPHQCRSKFRTDIVVATKYDPKNWFGKGEDERETSNVTFLKIRNWTLDCIDVGENSDCADSRRRPGTSGFAPNLIFEGCSFITAEECVSFWCCMSWLQLAKQMKTETRQGHTNMHKKVSMAKFRDTAILIIKYPRQFSLALKDND